MRSDILVAGGGMLVTTQKPDKTAFGMNGRSKMGFDAPVRALHLTLLEVRPLPNVGLGEPGGVSPPPVLGRKPSWEEPGADAAMLGNLSL